MRRGRFGTKSVHHGRKTIANKKLFGHGRGKKALVSKPNSPCFHPDLIIPLQAMGPLTNHEISVSSSVDWGWQVLSHKFCLRIQEESEHKALAITIHAVNIQ